MAKRKKSLGATIEGPLYPIKVRIVTKKYLQRIAAAKNETVLGCFVPSENVIYLAKELTPELLDHTLGHELYHAFEEQAKSMQNEEERANAFGSMLVKLLEGRMFLRELIKS